MCVSLCGCVGACVFVFRQVSAHPHEYAPSSYVYCPVTPHFCQPPFLYYLFVCLFVSGTFTIVILLPGSPQQGERSTFVSCHADNIARIEWEYTFGRELVNVNANTNQQTKTKEAQYGSLSRPEPLHLLCLPSPLVGVAIRSYNDRISFLTQGPS